MDNRLNRTRTRSLGQPFRKLAVGNKPGYRTLYLFLLCCLFVTQVHASNSCLDILPDESGSLGSFHLGRAFSHGEFFEPVLIRKLEKDDEIHYSFRDCSSRLPTETEVHETSVELYDSTLVAYFSQERTTALATTYRGEPSLTYQPEGNPAELVFQGTGGMLAASRLNPQYVEVTTTESTQIVPLGGSLGQKRVPILLFAPRNLLTTMDLEIWDELWGSEKEDSKIAREIVWVELPANPSQLKIHQPVNSFEKLLRTLQNTSDLPPRAKDRSNESSRLPGFAEAQLTKYLEEAAIALIVVNQESHLDFAETMLGLAIKTGSNAVLDIAALEDSWKKEQHLRLEGAAGRGRNWLLLRFDDLAAIMPERISNKVRISYYQSLRTLSNSPSSRFPKDYLTLADNPEIFRVGHALFLDRAIAMAQTLEFFSCLHEGSNKNLSSNEREAILAKGLSQLDLPVEDLRQMTVQQIFPILFQGLTLPGGLRASERYLLRGISRGDPEVLRLIYTLNTILEELPSPETKACKVALIPDDALLALRSDSALFNAPASARTVYVVDSFMELQQEKPLDKAAQARQKWHETRRALADAIRIKGSRFTKRKIRTGNQEFDSGKAALRQNNLDEAIRFFQEAIDTYERAKEIAWQKQHEKPKIRVH